MPEGLASVVGDLLVYEFTCMNHQYDRVLWVLLRSPPVGRKEGFDQVQTVNQVHTLGNLEIQKSIDVMEFIDVPKLIVKCNCGSDCTLETSRGALEEFEK